MVFKKESVLEQLKKLEQVIAKLKEREKITLEKYQQDMDVQWITERGLEIGASTILDIGNHILSGAYQISVDEYEQILKRLREKQVISKELYNELRGLEGFRNILVRGYLALSAELVYEHYRRALDSFPMFIAEIAIWLENFQSKE
ncbi:MAG: type VII toxin-antitoxin system HepT family RNase toxin [bacterium]